MEGSTPTLTRILKIVFATLMVLYVFSVFKVSLDQVKAAGINGFDGFQWGFLGGTTVVASILFFLCGKSKYIRVMFWSLAMPVPLITTLYFIDPSELSSQSFYWFLGTGLAAGFLVEVLLPKIPYRIPAMGLWTRHKKDD